MYTQDYHQTEILWLLICNRRRFNVKSFMRSGVTDQELKDQFKALWNIRDDRYSDERTEQTVANRKHKNQHELYWGLGPQQRDSREEIDGQCKLGLGFPTPKSP